MIISCMHSFSICSSGTAYSEIFLLNMSTFTQTKHKLISLFNNMLIILLLINILINTSTITDISIHKIYKIHQIDYYPLVHSTNIFQNKSIFFDKLSLFIIVIINMCLHANNTHKNLLAPTLCSLYKHVI